MNFIVVNQANARRLGLSTSPELAELQKKRTALIDEARKNLAKLEDEKISPAEGRKIEARHDETMAELDEVDEKIGRLQDIDVRAGQISMRPHNGDAESRGFDDGSEPYVDEPTQCFALRAKQSYSDFVRERHDGEVEFSDLSTGAYMRAMIIGPKSEAEKRALAEGTDSAGGYTVPDILSARMIDRMRAASVVMQAGAQTVPLLSDVNYIAKVLTDPQPAWRAENASIAESDPTFGRVTLTARSLGVIVKVSRELMEDSLNMETVLPNLLATSLAQELDRVALLGSGTPPEPRGVANFTGLTVSDVGGIGDPLSGYDALVKARTALRTVNSDVTAYVMSPRDEGWLAIQKDGQGQPLNKPPAIATIPMLVTSKIPVDLGTGDDESIILAGDWSRLMVGMRTNITLGVLRERYADNWQYGFVAVLRADIAAEHEAAFTKFVTTLPTP
ncbi:MAG: phage major capsid protein [Parvibaculaceae bacterium]